MVKKEMVLFLDHGLIGTFVRWVAHPSEDNFVYLEYVPMDTIPARQKRFEKPIPKDAIHAVDPLLQIPGVVDRLILIYTAEEGSIVKKVLENDYIKELDILKDRVKSLEMKNASLVQEVENARSGVSKAIASSRSLERKSTGPGIGGGGSIFDRLRTGSPPQSDSGNHFEDL